jgi:hypothetical protein
MYMNSVEDYAKCEKEDTFSDWMKSVRSLRQIIIIRTQWVNDDHKDQNVAKHLSHLHVVVPADNASKISFLCVNYIT